MTRKNLFGRSTSQGMIGRARSSDQKTMTTTTTSNLRDQNMMKTTTTSNLRDRNMMETTTTFDLRDCKIIKTTTIDHNMPDKVVQDVSVYFSSKPMTQAGDIQSNR